EEDYFVKGANDWLFVIEDIETHKRGKFWGDSGQVALWIAYLLGIPCESPIRHFGYWSTIKEVIEEGNNTGAFTRTDVGGYYVGVYANGNIASSCQLFARHWQGMSDAELRESYERFMLQSEDMRLKKGKAIRDSANRIFDEQTRVLLKQCLEKYPKRRKVLLICGSWHAVALENTALNSAPLYRNMFDSGL
ncbi:MAG: hypothetical protein Q8N76_02300, partial [Candidatus Omnitrophota bacterium]|nr:hypothetical protein [Candidatus Omnitrophota bacterium]